MSDYLVLARKYRSETFNQVVGQEPIAQTLINAINTNRIHHAYLFTGTRGVGKTTMARILAKALNCLSFDTPTATPCGKCEACLSIARGDDVDVVEIDGASNRGIDEMRELRANAVFRPARCRFKVYYIDEVHQVTKDAFNSLLKTLEEPPAHVKFIFATTEVEKIPATILSRCQRFDFRNIPTADIAGHLANICKSENVPAQQDALFRVARAAAGSMRDSLSLLDQILAGASEVTDSEVIRILGTPPDDRTLKIFTAIADSDSATAIAELNHIIETGVTLESIIRCLGDMARNMMLAATCGPTSDLIELPETQKQEIADLATRFSTPAIVQSVGIINNASRNIRNSSVGRALVEAALVRLAESEKFVDPSSLIARLEQLASGGANFQKKKPIASRQINPGAQPAGYNSHPNQGYAPNNQYKNNQPHQQPPRQNQSGASALFRRPQNSPQQGAQGDNHPQHSQANNSGNYASANQQQAKPAGQSQYNQANKHQNFNKQTSASTNEQPKSDQTPKQTTKSLTLSSTQQAKVRQDPAVSKILDSFGGEIIDIRQSVEMPEHIDSE